MTFSKLLPLALCLLAAPQALAQEPAPTAPNGWGSFSIENNQAVSIQYQVCWGQGAWQSFTLPPGIVFHHWYALDAYGRTPRPYVRFDCIGGDGRLTWKSYNVHTRATPAPGVYGFAYEFRFSPDGVLLDLYVRP